MHMSALKFTCEVWGSSEFKTELWKDGIDAHKLTDNKDSEGFKSTLYGSKTLRNHFESFWDWFGSAKKDINQIEESEKVEHDENNVSLKTFRIVVNQTPDQNTPIGTLEDYGNDGSVIVHDFTPSKLRFTSENEGILLLFLTHFRRRFYNTHR